MSYYMINCSPNHGRLETSESAISQQGKIKFVSKNEQIRPEINSQVILFDRSAEDPESHHVKEKYKLKHKGTVTDKSEAKVIPFERLSHQHQIAYKRSRERDVKPIEFFQHELLVDFEGTFVRNQLLDDFTFSLMSIYNYYEPHRHFSRNITELTKFDYDTLYEENVFASRTTFGRLFQGLPTENQIDFVQMMIAEYRTTNFSEISLLEGLSHLWEYINSILQLGHYLKYTNEMLRDDFSEILDPEKIGFASTKKVIEKSKEIIVEGNDSIQEQVELFEDVFSKEKSISRTIKHLSQVNDSESQIRFVKQFKSKSWPLKFNL
ncbi:MAG: hypothetical protein ABJG68_01565 [Crocinitomicaceae bacterium]